MKENFGVDPDLSTSSPLFKGATRLYELVKKKKNVKKSKETVIKSEEANLKGFEIDLGEKAVTVKDGKEKSGKRKNFDELTSKDKKRMRVKNVIEMLDSDHGLEEKVLEKLELRKGGEKSYGDVDLVCLALMKTTGISNTKYDSGFKIC